MPNPFIEFTRKIGFENDGMNWREYARDFHDPEQDDRNDI